MKKVILVLTVMLTLFSCSSKKSQKVVMAHETKKLAAAMAFPNGVPDVGNLYQVTDRGYDTLGKYFDTSSFWRLEYIAQRDSATKNFKMDSAGNPIYRVSQSRVPKDSFFLDISGRNLDSLYQAKWPSKNPQTIGTGKQ